MSLHITSTTKTVKVRPTTREQLRYIVEDELYRQGPDADLNHIDTSQITDMFILFKDLDIRNIKIDQWDVSNVTCMKSTFYDCKNFNCDLSSWDVSNVTDTSGMFYGCKNFNCDLSSWDMPNVKNMYGMFHNCVIDDSHKPNFK